MCIPPFNLTAITEEVVVSAICKLDPKKATGCDKLPIRFTVLRLVLRPWVGCYLLIELKQILDSLGYLLGYITI